MRKLLVPAGIFTAAALVAFGVVAVVAGLVGHSEQTGSERETLVGTPDMKPKQRFRHS